MAAAEAAQKVRAELGQDLCVCILGGTKFQGTDSEELVKAIARELHAAVGTQVCFVTGGMAGVQETFAKHCGDGSRVWNLLPEGQASGFGVGKDIHAGADLEARKAIFGQLGDVYITVEGGPGVAQEARAAHERGAVVLPLIRTGGASAGLFEFPTAALERPTFASEEEWDALRRAEAPVDAAAAAVAALVKHLVENRQPSIWEVLDQLIGLDRATTLKALAVVISVLFLVSGLLMYREVSRGRMDLALLHGGFLLLLVGLVGAIAFVLSEASRLEAEKSAAAPAAAAEAGGGAGKAPEAKKAD